MNVSTASHSINVPLTQNDERHHCCRHSRAVVMRFLVDISRVRASFTIIKYRTVNDSVPATPRGCTGTEPDACSLLVAAVLTRKYRGTYGKHRDCRSTASSLQCDIRVYQFANDRISEEGNAIGYVCLCFRLSFEPSDLCM